MVASSEVTRMMSDRCRRSGSVSGSATVTAAEATSWVPSGVPLATVPDRVTDEVSPTPSVPISQVTSTPSTCARGDIHLHELGSGSEDQGGVGGQLPS